MLYHHSFSLRKKYMLLRKDEIELYKLGVMLIRICCWSINSFCYETQIDHSGLATVCRHYLEKLSDSCFHVSWINVTVPLADWHLKYQPVNI